MKVRSLMSAYLDCELPGVDMLAVRQHLSDCSECGQEFEGMLMMKRAFGAMGTKLPATDLAERICLHLDRVSHPAHERALSKLYKHLTTFPGKMRLAALGMGVFAMLLVLRAGDVGTTPDLFAQFGTAPTIIEISSSGTQLPEIWLRDSAMLAPGSPAAMPVSESWVMPAESGSYDDRFSFTPSLIQVNY